MAKFESRFLQLSSTILLEYIINNNETNSDTIGDNVYNVSTLNPIVYSCHDGLLYNDFNGGSNTHNSIKHLAVPIDDTCNIWYTGDDIYSFSEYFTDDVIETNTSLKLPYDSIRLHILSGYSFAELYGIMFQVKTKNVNNEYVKLANWLYKKTDREYQFEKAIIINNKIYDKYIEFKIPSAKYLGCLVNSDCNIFNKNGLNLINTDFIQNIEITYSTILKDSLETVFDDRNNIIGTLFKLNELIDVEIPYESESNKFNIYLAESNKGNYLEFYCTWDNNPITIDTVNMFNTRIKLYSANGYKTEDIEDALYDANKSDTIFSDESRWSIYHEVITSFYDVNGQLIQTPQSYNIHQTFRSSDVSNPIKFNYIPVINNNLSDLSYITFEYTARLINSYDGTQIVRKGAITSYNTNRYNVSNLRLNTGFINNYKVYNKINRVNETVSNNINTTKTKYIREYVNSLNINVNANEIDATTNELIIKRYGGKYLLTLTNAVEDKTEYLDLMNTASYVLVYKDANGIQHEINCTYSDKMNLVYGQLEFNISPTDAENMYNVPLGDRIFAIKCKNIDGSNSIIKEIKYKF